MPNKGAKGPRANWIFAFCRVLQKSRRPGLRQITPDQDTHICLYEPGFASSCDRVLSHWCFERCVCHCFSPAQLGRTAGPMAAKAATRTTRQIPQSKPLGPWMLGQTPGSTPYGQIYMHINCSYVMARSKMQSWEW